MSKYTLNILCPSGQRRKVSVTSNSNLLQVLEDVCNEEGLDSSEWGLIYQRNKCDLTKQWRLLNIPTNATLEMYKLDLARKSDDINVQLQLPDNSRYPGWFEPTVTLQEMLDWYRIQPESMVAALDISLTDNYNSCPVCSYLSEEIIGDYALSNTTLRELGLTSGTAVIRYNLRPVSDNELQKINARIDEKLVRRRQQQHEREQKSKQQQPSSPKETTPSNPSRTLLNTTAPTTNDQEYSIFRDSAPSASVPARTGSQNQPKTVAEALGLNFSLDLENSRESRNNPQNFKFPESTRGKDLYRNDFEDDSRHAQNERPCDRRPIAYDLIKNRPKPEKQTTKPAQLPESFFDVTADDLRSVLRTLQKESTTENPLETSTMRERAQSARSLTYEQIAIRLVIDDHSILQAFFRPEEPLSRLLDFARQTLICPYIDDKDFYFYTTPPRVMLSDLRKPFSTYDLAPAAFVHLGHRTVSAVNVRLAPNVPIRSIEEANQLAAQYVFSRTRAANERERSSLYHDRPVSATSLTPRSAPRNPVGNSMDDKQLREKLRKFLPGKK